MTNKATLTCLSVSCPERFSRCCHAGSMSSKNGFICKACGQQFVGGKCRGYDGKSFFDYSLEEKKEIIDKAGQDAQKMMQETIRKATTPNSMMSNCHKAPMHVSTGDEGTSCYVCADCQKPCDPATTNQLLKSTNLVATPPAKGEKCEHGLIPSKSRGLDKSFNNEITKLTKGEEMKKGCKPCCDWDAIMKGQLCKCKCHIPTPKSMMSKREKCKHCKMPIAIRNLSGFCDHLHYPEYCDICNGKTPPAKEERWEKRITEANWKTNPLYGKIVDFVQGAMDEEYGDSNATALAIIINIIVPYIRLSRSQAYEEGKEEGRKQGEKAREELLESINRVMKKARRETIEEAKAIFSKHKEEPMTGNVVLLELDVLLDALKGKEKV